MKTFMLAFLIVGSFAKASTHIEHDFGNALKNIDIENACLSESEVRTLKPQKTCLQYGERKVSDGDGGYYIDYYCVKTGKQHFAYPRAYSDSVCVEYRQVGHGDAGYLECARSAKVEKFLAQTVKVRVINEYGDTSNWPGTVKSFTFPTCN